MPVMVSGNFLSGLMISQLENCLVFFFSEMQYLAGVSRMGLHNGKQSGLFPPISGHDLWVGIAGLAGEQLKLKKDFPQKCHYLLKNLCFS